MEKTDDYSLFKRLTSNRELSEQNVLNLMESISTRNLLEFRPILVDDSMQVIDGQHRLEAAKRLGISIYYQIVKKPPSNSVLLLNTNQKKWGLADYMNYFINETIEPYIQLKDFQTETSINLSVAISLMGGKGMDQRRAFKDGSFVFSEERAQRVRGAIEKSKEVVDFIRSSKTGSCLFLNNENFKIALLSFLALKKIDFTIFMKKLEMRSDLIRHSINTDIYRDIFVSIYNYKNKNPIHDPEEEATEE